MSVHVSFHLIETAVHLPFLCSEVIHLIYFHESNSAALIKKWRIPVKNMLQV